LDLMADETPHRAMPFDEFVAPHLSMLLRVARSLTRNAHDAEDLVQDTLVRAFRAQASFDGRHPRAWLLTILRNTHINRNRRQRPGLLANGDDVTGAADRRNAASPSAEDAATANAREPWVADVLGQLSQRHMEVVQLVDVEGLSYDEAAAALGIPAGTVMSRLHRARARMRSRLAHRQDVRSVR